MNFPLPRQEYEILLCHAYGITRVALLAHPEKYSPQNPRFLKFVQRRLKHEPIAYITGFQPFMSLDFLVNRSVLIPRSETEFLIEKTIEIIKDTYSPHLSVGNSIKIVDIGTGSGCIAVSLAKNLPKVTVIGIDSSAKTLAIARKNAKFHQVEDRCRFVKGNWLEPLKEKVDLIVSNPPYIPSAVIKTLEPDVKDWEPREALDGGKDGLKYIKKIIEEAPTHLKPNGYLLMEIGFDQGKKVAKLAKVKILKDYAGKDRIILACSREFQNA